MRLRQRQVYIDMSCVPGEGPLESLAGWLGRCIDFEVDVEVDLLLRTLISQLGLVTAT